MDQVPVEAKDLLLAETKRVEWIQMDQDDAMHHDPGGFEYERSHQLFTAAAHDYVPSSVATERQDLGASLLCTPITQVESTCTVHGM